MSKTLKCVAQWPSKIIKRRSFVISLDHIPFGKEILEVDHLHQDLDVLPDHGAEVVFVVALALQLEHHLLHGNTLAIDAAELVT